MKEKYMFNASGVIGGLPYTRYDFEHITDIGKEDQEIVRKWIVTALKPASFLGRKVTSEELRKALFNATGIQISDNQMKHAMLLCGFVPRCVTTLIWEYRLSMYSPLIREGMKHGRL